jgi:hypothetical protein
LVGHLPTGLPLVSMTRAWSTVIIWIAIIFISRKSWPLAYRPRESALRAWLSVGLTNIVRFGVSAAAWGITSFYVQK